MMKKLTQSWKKVLCVFLAATFILGVLPSMPASAAEKNSENTYTYGVMKEDKRGYQVKGKTYPLYKGAFRYAGYDPGKDSESLFYFSPGFFANDPKQYTPELATASATMAFAGFFSNEGQASTKRGNIVQYMQDIGCAPKDIYSNIYNTIEPQTDSIGVTMGSMKLDAVEEGRILIPISIRGGNYGKEWASNVTLGTQDAVADGEAKGFATAATIVYSEIQNYINNHNLQQKAKEGKLTFWITGFSRAGATANLTAKRLVDEYIPQNNKVFAYCIEAPAGGTYKAVKKEREEDYYCIHSVINKGDIVPLVAPGGMDFMRYGADHYVPGGTVDELKYMTPPSMCDNMPYNVGSPEYNIKHGHMIGQLKAVQPNRKFSDFFETRGLDLDKLRGLGISLLSTIGFIVTVIVVTVKVLQDKKEVVLKTGKKALMGDFIYDAIKHMQEWTELNRDSYAGARAGNLPYYGNIETALRDYMSITRDSTPAQMAEFKKRVQSLWDNGEIGVMKLVTLFFNAFDKWGELSSIEREYYKGMLVDWLEKCKCFDALELTASEKERVLRTDVPALLDFAMTYASKDYHEDLYGTDGFTQILTLLRNIENILENHAADVVLAWLRAYDPLYEHDSEPIEVEYKPTQAPVLSYAGKDVLDMAALTINPKKLGTRGNTLEIAIPGAFVFGTRIGYEIKKGGATVTPATYYDMQTLEINRLPDPAQGTEYELIYWSENKSRNASMPIERKSVKLKVDYGIVPVTVYTYDRAGNEKKDVYNTTAGQKVVLNTDDPDGKYFIRWDVVYELNNGSKKSETLEYEESSFEIGNNVKSVTAKPVFLDLPEEDIAVDLPYPFDWESIGENDPSKFRIVPEDSSLPNKTEYIMADVDKQWSDDRSILKVRIPKKVKTWNNKEKKIRQRNLKLKLMEDTETPIPIPSGNPDIRLEKKKVTETDDYYEIEIAVIRETEPKPQGQDITITGVNLVTGEKQEITKKSYKDGDTTKVEAPDLNNLLFYRWADLTDDTQYEPERTAPSEGNLTAEYIPIVEKMEFTVVLPEEEAQMNEEVQMMKLAAPAAGLTSCVLTLAGGGTYMLTEEQLQAFTVEQFDTEIGDNENEWIVPVMIVPGEESILSVLPITSDVSMTVNGTEAYYGSLFDEGETKTGIFADLSVPAPAPEPEPEKSTEISIIVDPDDIMAEHGSELSALLPAEVLVQYTDGRIESLPVTWNTADAVWSVFKENEDERKEWQQLPDTPVANIADQVYCALTGDVQEPEGTTFVEETAGAGMVTLGVYIAGLPDAEMPWPTHFEGEYDEPIDLGLTSVDADGNDTGARIFYTLDGSNPKTSPTSMLYTGPITLGKGISEPTEYTVLAYAAGDYVNTDDSDIMYSKYTINPVKEEKKDVTPADKNKVDTGDPNHMTYWIIGMAAALVLIAAAVIIFAVRRRKRK